MFYSHNEDPHNIHTETLGGNILSYTVDVLGGASDFLYFIPPNPRCQV